jgi:hypothetical protein
MYYCETAWYVLFFVLRLGGVFFFVSSSHERCSQGHRKVFDQAKD